MHADYYFTIGKTHEVCEDYARAGVIPNGRVYGIVADGCSSSPDTDFGARFLTMEALSQISWDAPQFSPQWLVETTRSQVLPPLAMECLDATLLVAYEMDGVVHVAVTGDGVVAGLKRDGSLVIWDIDYEGRPGYISYLLDRSRWDRYVKLGWANRVVTRIENGQMEMAETTTEAVTREILDWRLELDVAEYQAVFLMSDGVHSFQKQPPGQGMEPIPMPEVVAQITGIKNAAGSFLRRRCNAFEKRFCLKNHWHHDDDLGVAAIWTGDVCSQQE